MVDASSSRIPLWIKIAYTAFMAVLIPVYLKNYGATNFLYFCDVALFMTLVGIWLESPLLLSSALVGIFLPQMLWVVDFIVEVSGRAGILGREPIQFTGMTSYMFKPPYFLRFLSFFHFWLPFLLAGLVWRVGYDQRGMVTWMIIMWVLVTICYVWMPPPSPECDPLTGLRLRDPNVPVNINYVYNILGNDEPQKWMDPDLYLTVYMAVLAMVYWSTHEIARRVFPRAGAVN